MFISFWAGLSKNCENYCATKFIPLKQNGVEKPCCNKAKRSLQLSKAAKEFAPPQNSKNSVHVCQRSNATIHAGAPRDALYKTKMA